MLAPVLGGGSWRRRRPRPLRLTFLLLLLTSVHLLRTSFSTTPCFLRSVSTSTSPLSVSSALTESHSQLASLRGRIQSLTLSPLCERFHLSISDSETRSSLTSTVPSLFLTPFVLSEHHCCTYSFTDTARFRSGSEVECSNLSISRSAPLLEQVRLQRRAFHIQQPKLCICAPNCSPASIRVSLSHRSDLSLSYMGLSLSTLHFVFDPVLSPSWLNSSGHYRHSSTPLFHLEKVPKRVMCSGSPENLIIIPDEHLTRASLKLDALPFQETHMVTSSHSLRFEFISCRLCSPLWKLEISTSETSRLIPALSLLVGHAEGSYSPIPTGGSTPSHSTSSQDRYNLPTPIVLNLKSKFTVDIGALHGINSVMVEEYLSSGICTWRVALRFVCNNHHCPSLRDRYNFHMPTVLNLLIKLFLVNFGLFLHGFEDTLNTVVSIVFSPTHSVWRLSLIFDQVCYRVRAAVFTGCYISVFFSISLLEEALEGLQRFTNLAMMIIVKTLGIGDKLLRSVHMKVDFGLCLIFSASQSYVLDQKTIHRSSQIKWIQLDQRFYLCNWFSVVWNLFLFLFCKREIESLDFHYPKM